MIKYIFLLFKSIIYIFIGSLIFFEIVNILQFKVNNTQNTKHELNITAESNFLNKIEQENIKKQLYSDLNIKKSHINNTINNREEEMQSRYVFFKYLFKNNNIVIPSLYIIIYISFVVQLFLLSISSSYSQLLKLFSEKKLDSVFMQASEWASNAPPVLGVVGTIFSFGLVVSNLNDVSILGSVFKENFANAAQTTILGGVVYVINLFLNIFIAKNLSK